MGANPPKNDAWPEPTTWLHVWVKVLPGNAPPPMPGLVLDWQRRGSRWRAWVIWVDDTYGERRHLQGWIDERHLRPARSDINVWNSRRRHG